MSSFFLDANFFLDITDASRKRHALASACLEKLLENDAALFTSSDILTTVAYFVQKYADLSSCVTTIDSIVREIKVICAMNDDFISLNSQLAAMTSSIDYEDALQFYLANKQECEYLVTSDNKFCRGFGEGFKTDIIDLEKCQHIL